MKLYHLVAVCNKNMCIGNKGDLPWPKNKSDMQHFKSTTNGGIVIMGRKTFESLPNGGLPNRVNIIITKDKDYKVGAGNIVSNTINGAILTAEQINETLGLDAAYIIGGAEIYKQTLDLIDGKIITLIKSDYDGDTFLDSNYVTDKQFKTQSDKLLDDGNLVLYMSRK